MRTLTQRVFSQLHNDSKFYDKSSIHTIHQVAGSLNRDGYLVNCTYEL